MNAVAKPNKISNFKRALDQPRTRLVFFGTFALIAVIVLIAWMVFARKSSQAEKELQSAVSAPPVLQSQGGGPQAATPEYDKLLQQGNEQAAAEALQHGGSAIPVPRTGTVGTDVTIGPQQISQSSSPQPPAETGAYSQQPTQEERQAFEQAVQARMAMAGKQMEKLQAYWATQSHSSVRVAPAPSEAQQTGSTGAQSIQAGAAGVAGASGAPVTTMPDIRMGEMKYAVLKYGINTDDPAAPNMVQATIHEPGQFNGATVIGQVEVGDQYAKAVGIHFTRMSVPGEPRTREIDAWAVNPKTDRPSVASDVNNHYVSRAASLFIGSFLSGYADGLLKGGQNESVVSNGTTTVVQRDAFSDRQLIEIGVGNVGKTASQQFSQGANRKPTIQVDAGIDLGIWFTQDVPSIQ